MKTYLRLLSYIKPYWKHLSASIIFTILFALLNGASVYLTIPLLDTLFIGKTTAGQTSSEQAGSAQKGSEQPKGEKTPDIKPHTDNSAAYGTDKSGKASELNSPGAPEKPAEVRKSGDSSAGSGVRELMPGWFSQVKTSVERSFNNFVFGGSKTDALIRICILVLLAFLAKNIFGYLQAYYMAYVEQGLVMSIRNDAYMHLHKLPMGYFKNEKTGNLISRITNDVNVLQSSVPAVFLNLIREPLTIVVFLGIALSISWQLTLVSILALPFSLAIIAYIGLVLRKQSRKLQEKMSDITTVLHETISGVKIVKAFGMEDYENRKFLNETRSFFDLILRIVRIRNASSPITEFLSVAVGVFIIYYGGRLVLIEGSIKASEFLGFLFAIFQLMPPVKELSGVHNRMQESGAAADRIFEILDTEPAIKDIEKPVILNDFTENIVFENLSFHYDDSDELVLKNLNFTARKGQVIALVGSSGSGKTTLADLLPRFYDPTEGRILIDGTDIRHIGIGSLRRLMGIVTQETVLFNDTIKNNIAYGLDGYSMEKIEAAAKAANAHDFIMEFPKGYDTLVGERGAKISGGQRQRLSIARALLVNPPIMIFDEATSALDNESEVLVQEAIERLMTERTTFVIAHRLSTIRNADVIIVLDKGRIVQMGRHFELLEAKDGIYAKLYELQFRD